MHICHANKAVEADQKLPKKKQKGAKHGNEYYLNYGIATLGVLLAGVSPRPSTLDEFFLRYHHNRHLLAGVNPLFMAQALWGAECRCLLSELHLPLIFVSYTT
jgi:hypothetical protein